MKKLFTLFLVLTLLTATALTAAAEEVKVSTSAGERVEFRLEANRGQFAAMEADDLAGLGERAHAANRLHECVGL